MKSLGEILHATEYLCYTDRLRLALFLTRDYDGSTVEALAEAWAEDKLMMEKTDKGVKGIDGILPNGRTLQVKSKKSGAHTDSATYVTLSKGTLECAKDLLVVFVNYDTAEIDRTVGPVSINELKARNGRYYIGDIDKSYFDIVEK